MKIRSGIRAGTAPAPEGDTQGGGVAAVGDTHAVGFVAPGHSWSV